MGRRFDEEPEAEGFMITNESVNQAIDYILRHMEEDVTLDDVAEYCHFSKYYFSRLFKEQTGESVYAFIRRLRLEQSASAGSRRSGRIMATVRPISAPHSVSITAWLRLFFGKNAADLP